MARMCLLLSLFLTTAWVPLALSQGGPPLRTDDPGTPGNHNWEINTAFTIESRAHEHEYEAPIVDINYGWGDRVQLKFELPWLVHGDETRSRSGLGNSLVGVKWRFVEDERHGIQVSTYPQLELNNPTHSVGRGLVERGPGFLLPIEVTKKLGPIDLNAETGYWFQRRTVNRWIAGLAAGHQFNHRLEGLTEVYSIGSEAGRDTTWDFGGRLHLFSTANFLFMAGRSFRGLESGEPKLIGYFGLQLLLPAKHDQTHQP